MLVDAYLWIVDPADLPYYRDDDSSPCIASHQSRADHSSTDPGPAPQAPISGVGKFFHHLPCRQAPRRFDHAPHRSIRIRRDGGRHIHHLVWGILLLLISGYATLAEVGTGETPQSILMSRILSMSYGIGAALTLDEFALWLNLDAAAYWSHEGRESIDAVVLFGALLAMGTWGAPLLRWMIRGFESV
jgi:hypothetical protein